MNFVRYMARMWHNTCIRMLWQ